jgi:hypothetical protein
VKEAQLERSGGVRQADLEGSAPAVTDPRLRHLALDRHQFAGLQGPDRTWIRAILVAQGQMEEQILDGHQA